MSVSLAEQDRLKKNKGRYINIVMKTRSSAVADIITLLILLLIVVGTCPRPCVATRRSRGLASHAAKPRPCDPPFGRAQLVNY